MPQYANTVVHQSEYLMLALFSGKTLNTEWLVEMADSCSVMFNFIPLCIGLVRKQSLLNV
jgi:hypothetical protein